MKTKTKMIVLSIIMFVAGIAAAWMAGRFIMLPDLAKDISKVAYEIAGNAYQVGYTDGTNQNSDMYDTYFDEDEMEELSHWEYKYIK